MLYSFTHMETAERPDANARPVLAHIFILAILTSLTNAAAIAQDTFGGVTTVTAFTIATLVVASAEAIVRGHFVRGIPFGGETQRDREVLRLHGWCCILAAGVSTLCALISIITLD